MPCNPSIGGTAKGHLVREVDALGGLMGIAADATFLQSRMLNRGKGPAVHSLRVQTDRKRYHMWMKHALEKTPNLDIHPGRDRGRGYAGTARSAAVVTNLGGYYGCNGAGHLPPAPLWAAASLWARLTTTAAPTAPHAASGADRVPGGAGRLRCAGLRPAPRPGCTAAASTLRQAGASARRPGRGDCSLFSFLDRESRCTTRWICYIAYTNPETHKVILR